MVDHGWWFPQSPHEVNKIPSALYELATRQASAIFCRTVSQRPEKLLQLAVPGAKEYLKPQDAKIFACSLNYTRVAVISHYYYM